MTTIANPIYDIVFKYLMEDERIARTILSALLKKDVVAVQVRPHEYANDKRDSLSVFRIDFGATVRDEDGSEHLILIELQKTWLETETLRFRQYLGVHYSNPRNMRDDGNALPMVAVYLLGHRVGGVDEPVLYVSHRAYDYDGNLVENGLPNAFVESLTHESIIVQIPLLRGQINNRLDKVLSFFDQSRIDESDHRMLRIDASAYENDAEMDHILRRLTMAAADADMRHRMNVEDEYYSVIEKRDTEIRMRDLQLAEKDVQLAEKEEKLAAQNVQLAEKEEKLAAQDVQLAEKEEKLAAQDVQLAEKDGQLAEKDGQLAKTIQLLMQAGMQVGDIAKHLQLDVETIKRLAES